MNTLNKLNSSSHKAAQKIYQVADLARRMDNHELDTDKYKDSVSLSERDYDGFYAEFPTGSAKFSGKDLVSLDMSAYQAGTHNSYSVETSEDGKTPVSYTHLTLPTTPYV